MNEDGIELRHLRVFLAVANELNFSRAAHHLHLAQQSVSAQVQRLEHEIGVELFRRNTRRVELTEAGAVLLDKAPAILGLVTAAVDDVRRKAAGETGRLVISYTPTLIYETLPCLVRAVHERYPGLTLQMCEMWQAEGIAAVRAGRVDAGMARPAHVDDDLESVRLRDEPLGAVLGANHPLAGNVHVTPMQLANFKLAIWPRDFSPDFFDQVVDFLRAYGFHGSIHEFEYFSADAFSRDPISRTEMATGSAFSVAFEAKFDTMPDGLVWRPLEPAPQIPVQLFWRRDAGAAVRSFVEVCQQVSHGQRWLSRAAL